MFSFRSQAACCGPLLSVLMLAAGCNTDWKEAAVGDIEAMHRTLLENHPGAVDPENPEFATQLETAFRSAMERAEEVNSSAGYFYALRSFTTPFHDEHLKVGFFAAPDRTMNWPGFVVGSDGEGNIVVIRRDDESAPPTGSKLIACDGVDVEEFIQTSLQPYIGNWALPSKRPGDAPFLLIDSANPFVKRPSVATFEIDGERREFELEWRLLSDDMLNEIVNATEPETRNKTEWRVLEDGTIWISIASFNIADPAVKTANAALVEKIRNGRAQIESAPALVIDVRGNDGGSQSSAIEIAQAIWGDDYIQRVRPRIERVDWRASAENVAALGQFLPMLKQAFGESSETYMEMATLQVKMEEALARGQDYCSVEKDYPSPVDADPLPVPAQTFFLNDHSLVSAGLDFADIVLAIPGVVQIGRETAGDTRYLDIRQQALPSGRAQLVFPVAAHRGRVRGDNQSYSPVHYWKGSIADTPALEKWVAELRTSDSQ